MIHIDNSGLSKNTLIVGADDSNHCGDSKGEIIMVTFSWYNPDCVVKDYPNRRDYGAAYKWLEQGEEFRDYFFSVLAAERFRREGSNLLGTVPSIVAHYLSVCDLKKPEILKVYFDGRAEKRREDIKRIFSNTTGIENIYFDNFIKKHRSLENGRIIKHPHCPSVVYFADVLANDFYANRSFEDLVGHRNLVSLITN